MDEIETLRQRLEGAVKSDAKAKRRMHRLERAIVGEVDKKNRLKYEVDRLENVLVDVYKHPEHAKHIIPRAIPKRIYRENLDPGKKEPKVRKSRGEERTEDP